MSRRALGGQRVQRTDLPPCQAVLAPSSVICGRSPALEVSFTCPCGHEGSRSSCPPHAEPGAGQACGLCADGGHYCPVTLTGKEPQP